MPRRRSIIIMVLASPFLMMLAGCSGDPGVFAPFVGLLDRVLSAFASSVALLVVVVAAAIPWIAVLALGAWLALRVLRFWIHRKRALKAKKEQQQ